MLGWDWAYLPEDRDRDGLIMAESVVHNIHPPHPPPAGAPGRRGREGERRVAAEAAAAYNVKATSIEQAVAALSGGNRQRSPSPNGSPPGPPC